MIECAVHCTANVHAALWHRVRASVVRVGHVLVHGQRVGQTHGQRSVSDTCNIESVSSTQPVVVQNALHNQQIDDSQRIASLTRTVNDSDTIKWLHNQRVNAIDLGMTKARHS